MRTIFNLDNPVWKFIGNIADFFLLTLMWTVCSLPIVTLGASTSALYYTTLKMASNQEGYTLPSFWKAFKNNLLSGIKITIIMLMVILIVLIDLYYCLVNPSTITLSLILPLGVILTALIFSFRLVVILLARCDNTVKNLLFMSVSLGLKNFMPVLSTLIVSAGAYLFGVFIFWPVLLIAPGLCAYINSFVFNRILTKYGFAL